MPGLVSILLPLTLLGGFPVENGNGDRVLPSPEDAAENAGRELTAVTQEQRDATVGSIRWERLLLSFRPDPAQQVRIERRVIVRISPRRRLPEGSSLVASTEPVRQARWVEKKMDDCLPLDNIVGARPASDNRLLLYLNDRRIVSLHLEKSCAPAAFYSGFYVERSADGRLCRKRDTILSRSGAKCEVTGLRQLVPIETK